MMVVDLDGHDLNVIQISVNPDQLSEQIKEHRSHHRDDAPAED